MWTPCESGDRPDQVCQRCLQPVKFDDRWVACSTSVFHKRCFNCQQCSAPLPPCYEKLTQGQMTCSLCEAKILQAASDLKQKTVEIDKERKCTKCERILELSAMTTEAGTHWCDSCCHCTNCLQPIHKECFEVLDELYCVGCEQKYRDRFYLITHMGSGTVSQLTLEKRSIPLI